MPTSQPSEENDPLREFFATVAESDKERSVYANEAPEAMRRLARAVYGHDNSQALTVAACLASIYNGGDARPVRLDEIRWLDWSLQRDLLAVLVGTGVRGHFEDVDIRKAFFEVGGQSAVEDLHWHTTGGPHRSALRRLVELIKADRSSSSARTLLEMLKSLHKGSVRVDLSELDYLEQEHAKSFVLVLDGLVGRDKGCLKRKDVGTALEKGGLL